MKENESTLNGQIGNTLNTEDSKELFHVEREHGTPFVIVTNNETGKSFVGLGSYRLTDESEDVETLKDMIWGQDWDFLFSVLLVIALTIRDEEKKIIK